MSARYLVAVLVLVLTGCAPAPVGPLDLVPPSTAEYVLEHGRPVQVERVIDGDTLAVSGDERVRLLTIDSPELNSRSADPPECGAEAARADLAELLPIGTAVLLNGLKGGPDQDRYGRTLSNVYLPQGVDLVNVSLRQVAHGWATVHADYPTNDTADADLLEAGARAARAGIWGACR